MKNKTRYKFLRLVDGKIKSDSGDHTWEIGKWYKEDKINMCKSGFHCSKEIYQAFSYVQGEILAEVGVKGKSETQDDKDVWSEMKINKCWKWQKKDSVALSIYSAELVLDNFEKKYPDDKRPRQAIEAAKKVLFDDTEENRSAAKSAAWSARSAESAAWSAESAAWSARSEAWSEAWSAAWSEAESAAWSEAWSAAESAAWSARSARSALIKKISTWMDEHLKELEIYE